MTWHWWVLGIVAYMAFLVLENRPELQPMRDSMLYKLLWKAAYSSVILYFAWFSKLRPERPGQLIMTLMAFAYWQILFVPSQRLLLLHITLLVFAGIGYLLWLKIQTGKNNAPLSWTTVFMGLALMQVDYTYQDGNTGRHWEISLLMAVLAGAAAWYLIFNGILRLKDDRMSEKVCWCVVAAGAAFALSFFTANNLNYMLDYSLPEQYSMTIAQKDIQSSRSGTDYEFLLTYKGEEIKMDVSQSIYYQYEVGDSFPVELYQGFFGDAYYIAE